METSNDPTANYISQKLYDLLHTRAEHPGRPHGRRAVTIADIQLQTNVDEVGVEPADVYMQWNLKLGGDLVNAGAGIDFDLGIPGLGLRDSRRGAGRCRRGKPGLRLRHRRGQGFYLDLSDADELRLDADVTLPGAGLTGRLAFLQLDADDNGDTGLGATIAVDIYEKNHNDDRVGIADFGNIRMDAGIAAEAIVDLGMELQLNSELVPGADTVFPKVVGDFYFEWGIGDRDAGDAGLLRRHRRLDPGRPEDGRVPQRGAGPGHASSPSSSGRSSSKVQEITEPIQPIDRRDHRAHPGDLRPGRPADHAARHRRADHAARYVDVGLIRDIADIITLINSIPTDVAS